MLKCRGILGEEVIEKVKKPIDFIGEDSKKYICLTEEGKNCANIIWQELVQCDIIQENNFKLTAKKS